MTKVRSLSLLSAGAALAVTAAIALGAVSGPSPVSAAPSITFEDNFDGPSGTAPNTSKWGRDIGGGGWGNNEHQYYTNSTRNAALDGAGNLVLTARSDDAGGLGCWYGTCKYTSARLQTAGKFSQAYGRFEARIKLPRGQGIWPAFWMLGDNLGSAGWPAAGEIDIMENVGREPGTLHGTIHGPGYSGAAGPTRSTTLPNGEKLADAFHTYAIEWAPNSITWYLDGRAFSTKTPADIGGNKWVFDHNFYLILNLAVGGNWPGYPDASTQFPQQMIVDYVRVWNRDTGGGGGAAVRALGKCMDVAGANSADGTPVQLYDCNTSSAQRWTRVGETLRAYGKCLDIFNNGTAQSAKMVLWPCTGGGNQVFAQRADGSLVNPRSNRCLDVPGANPANGNQLQIYDCNGSPAQKWTVG